MSEQSPRFQLPFLIPGQAQKEHFHNEALVRIDLALHPAVEAAALDEPPAAPEEGQCWIVGAAATGAWTGQEGRLAMWTGGGWRFVAPLEGMSVWDKSAELPLRSTGSAWNGGEIACASVRIGGQQVVGERQPAVPSPSGGTVIDAEARAAINAVVATLMSHGLID
jgi:hypothetical protein